MASLRQIRRRMRSVGNIHDITKAMEMIAGFRYKKAENRLSQAKPYLVEMEKLVGNLSVSIDNLQYPLFEKRQIRKKALAVMTGDKGLCGAYNANLIKAALKWASQNESLETSFIPIGKVGSEFFKRKHMSILASYPEKATADVTLARQMTDQLKEKFLQKEVDSIELLYIEHLLGGAGRIQIRHFLSLNYLFEGLGTTTFPVTKYPVDFTKNKKQKKSIDYIYEPSFNEVFIPLVERFLEGKLYLSLLESLASEYGARMVAMKQATENAEDVLDDLTLLRNKTRQATITRELSEIVSGANALV